MTAIRKKTVIDDRGNPREVIISWAQFRELSEALGLDLDEKAKGDLRATRRDLKRRKPLHSSRSPRFDGDGAACRPQSRGSLHQADGCPCRMS